MDHPALYIECHAGLFRWSSTGSQPDPYDAVLQPGNHPISSVASARVPGAPRSEFPSAPNKKFVLQTKNKKTDEQAKACSTWNQFTKRLSRTLFTSPNIKNVDSVFEPPALISGRGMPVTGILPTTIPTFTNK